MFLIFYFNDKIIHYSIFNNSLKVAIATRKQIQGDLGFISNIPWSMATHECGDS